MKRFRAAAMAGVVLAAACSDGPTSPRARTIVEIVQSGAPLDERTIALGATLRLQAEVTDGSGKALTGRTVDWKTTEPGVATVDAAGTVTAGSTAGTTRIIASVGGSADTAVINVAAPVTGALACAPGEAGLRLAVGEAYETSAWDAPRLCLDGGSGSEYVLIPFHASAAAEGQQVALELAASGVRSVTGPPSPSLAPREAGSVTAWTSDAEPDIEFHQRLRERALPGLERRMRAMRGGGDVAGPSFSIAAAAAAPRVGELMSLNTQAQSGDGCSSPKYRTGRVVAITARAVVVADTANPAGGFTDEEYRAFGTEFDQIVYPLNVEHFGQPSDVDKNQRVTIFFTRAVNDMTTAGTGYYIGGFFFDRDLFPKRGSGACEGSNVAEMFYMMVPDPVRQRSEPAFSKSRVKERTLAVIGHEFQHLINASRRLHVNDAESWEESWLNEGLSHIAEELLFYRVSGLQPRQNLDAAALRSATADVALRAYQLDNFERLVEHLVNPTRSSPMGNADQLATRGASWAFLRYAADRRAGGERDLWHRLVNSKTAGVRNLTQVLGTDALAWMQDWSVSVYTDDAGIPADPRHQQPSWNYRALLPQLPLTNHNIFRYPLAVSYLGSTAPQSVQLRSGGAAYVRFGVEAGRRAMIQTTSGGLPAPRKVRLTLVRTK